MEKTIGSTTLLVKQGDITAESVDAVVNAANSSLVPGGGVDGAIHRAGGPAIAAEARRIGHCETGEAVITTGGRLPVRHVIHTVGPVWYGGDHGEERLLASAYARSLELAEERGLATVAFPAISTGAFGYPLRDAARVAIAAIAGHLAAGSALREVRVVIYAARDLPAWEEALAALP